MVGAETLSAGLWDGSSYHHTASCDQDPLDPLMRTRRKLPGNFGGSRRYRSRERSAETAISTDLVGAR